VGWGGVGGGGGGGGGRDCCGAAAVPVQVAVGVRSGLRLAGWALEVAWTILPIQPHLHAELQVGLGSVGHRGQGGSVSSRGMVG
jgi:hypothetical protein